LIAKLRLRNGRIEYIDRSIKEPAEMRIKNVEMDIDGLDLKGRTRFKFAAAITEGLRHDVRIEGEWGPISRDLNWAQQPVNFDIQFDSLPVPVIARAIAFLRDKIPRELEDIHKARFIGDDLNFGIFESQRVDNGPAPKQIPKADSEEQLSRAHKGSRGKTGMIGDTELFGGKADSSEEARFDFLEINFLAENFLQFLVNLIQILVG